MKKTMRTISNMFYTTIICFLLMGCSMNDTMKANETIEVFKYNNQFYIYARLGFGNIYGVVTGLEKSYYLTEGSLMSETSAKKMFTFLEKVGWTKVAWDTLPHLAKAVFMAYIQEMTGLMTTGGIIIMPVPAENCDMVNGLLECNT